MFALALARFLPGDFAGIPPAPLTANQREAWRKRAARLPPVTPPHDRLVPLQMVRLNLLVDGPANALAEARKLALVLDPDLARILSEIAAQAVVRKEFNAAVEALTFARRLDPLEPQHRVDLAAVRLVQGQPLEATTILQTLVDSGHATADVYRLLSQARLSLGEPEAAYDALLRVVRTCPEGEHYRCAMDLARLCLQSAQPDRGLEPVQAAIAAAEGDALAEAYLLKGQLHVAAGQTREAEAALERCLEIRTDHPAALSALKALRPGAH